jgi:hypothetical protein
LSHRVSFLSWSITYTYARRAEALGYRYEGRLRGLSAKRRITPCIHRALATER